MAEIWMNAQRRVGYARFAFRNGSEELAWDEILEAMLWARCYLDILNLRRALIVIDTPMKDYYPIGELERHAKAANSVYRNTRIAFYNAQAIPQRVRFIQGILNQLGKVAIRSFNDEALAIKWLLSDDP